MLSDTDASTIQLLTPEQMNSLRWMRLWLPVLLLIGVAWIIWTTTVNWPPAPPHTMRVVGLLLLAPIYAVLTYGVKLVANTIASVESTSDSVTLVKVSGKRIVVPHSRSAEATIQGRSWLNLSPLTPADKLRIVRFNRTVGYVAASRVAAMAQHVGSHE